MIHMGLNTKGKGNYKLISKIIICVLTVATVVMSMLTAQCIGSLHDINEELSALKEIVGEIEFLKERIKEIEDEMLLEDVKSVNVTAYTLNKEECGEDFTITASMIRAKPGMVAVSRDLFDDGWTFGKRIYISGIGIFTVADLIKSTHKNKIDVLMFNKKAAKKFGIRKGVTAAIIRKGT